MKIPKHLLLVSVLILSLSSSALAVTDRPLQPVSPAVLEQSSTDTFSFAVFGDFRTSRRDRPYLPATRQIIDEIALAAPPFVLATGDAYYGYGGTFQRFKNEVDYFLSIVRTIPAPLYNAIGNHEATGEAKRQRYIAERFGNLHGSFDYGNAHFIAINTEEPGHEGALSPAQLSWLEADLKANAAAGHIFVFLHRPLFSILDPDLSKGKSFRSKAIRDDLHALFKKYGVRVVFAGHEHLFNDKTVDGVRYVIAGGGGAPLYGAPQKGGFLHYIIVHVNGKNVSMDVREPFQVQIRHLTQSHGFDPRSETEVANAGHMDLPIRNLAVLMPRAPLEKYRVEAVTISTRGVRASHPAGIWRVDDNGDGTATVRINTNLPKNGMIRVVVEAEL